MMYQNRDAGINHIKARKDRRCYGMGLGIIILDEVYPGFPGDVDASLHILHVPGGFAQEMQVLALQVKVGFPQFIEVHAVVNIYLAPVARGMVAGDKAGVDVKIPSRPGISFDGDHQGFGELFPDIDEGMDQVHVIRDLSGNRLAVIQDPQPCKIAVASLSCQEGNAVPHAGQFFSQRPDDPLGASIFAHRQAAIINDQDVQ